MPQVTDLKQKGVESAMQVALVRLLLFVTGELHRGLNDVVEMGRRALASATPVADVGDAGKETPLAADGLSAYLAQEVTLNAWGEFFEEYQVILEAARREAAWLAFGGLAVRQEWLKDQVGSYSLTEAATPRDGGSWSEQRSAVQESLFEPQLQAILDAGETRVIEGMQLSDRIWRVDQEAQERIKQVYLNALSQGQSAWDLAKELEQYLGAGQDCPRWTSTRLFGRTKGEIAAGDQTGLKRGDDCAEQGVAWNALRLARNEIQVAHQMANDAIWAKIPWIEKEKIHLSDAHPPIGCECESIAGKEYPKGEIILPIHIQCMCYKTAVLMKADDFTSQLGTWMRQGQGWPAMDEYQEMIGGDVSVSLLDMAGAVLLGVWLWGKEEELEDAIGL